MEKAIIEQRKNTNTASLFNVPEEYLLNFRSL